jgi:membrane protein DedA with SNARE-associated domain
MELIINSILNLLHEHWYIFAFLGALFEGTYIMILAGVLYKFGYFNFWGLIGVLSLGYFINGLFFYLIGRWGGQQILEKWIKKLHITRKLFEKLEAYFEKHSVKTLFITRITYGLSIPTLIIAGSFKMKLKKFILVTIVAGFVWIFVMLGVGYIFGISYEAIGSIAKGIATGFAVFLFIVAISLSILIIYWLRKSAKIKFLRRLENHRFAFLRGIGKMISGFNNKKNGK